MTDTIAIETEERPAGRSDEASRDRDILSPWADPHLAAKLMAKSFGCD